MIDFLEFYLQALIVLIGDCQRRLDDIEHPAAARRFRDQEPET